LRPFTLGVLCGPWGWSLFGGAGSLAAVGVVVKAPRALQTRTILQSAGFSLALCLAMGWLAILAMGPVVKCVPPRGIVFLFCGGIAYTLGTAFFWHERIPYFHSVWHLFVLAGASFHFVAVINHAT
jgi:hemolysin III